MSRVIAERRENKERAEVRPIRRRRKTTIKAKLGSEREDRAPVETGESHKTPQVQVIFYSKIKKKIKKIRNKEINILLKL